MTAEESATPTARILYRPFGLASSVIGGVIAGMAFKQVWRRASPTDADHAPRALESEFSLRQVVVAAALQGAVFAAVKATIDRGGARAFQRWTGEWPGD